MNKNEVLKELSFVSASGIMCDVKIRKALVEELAKDKTTLESIVEDEDVVWSFGYDAISTDVEISSYEDDVLGNVVVFRFYPWLESANSAERKEFDIGTITFFLNTFKKFATECIKPTNQIKHFLRNCLEVSLVQCGSGYEVQVKDVGSAERKAELLSMVCTDNLALAEELYYSRVNALKILLP